MQQRHQNGYQTDDIRTGAAPGFTLEKLQSIWPANTRLLGVVLFGSRTKPDECQPDSDWDIGIIYSGETPRLNCEDNWDIFLWEADHWERGFVLQLEIASSANILYDPEQLIQKRFTFLQEKILPHWAGYLKRL